MRYSDCRDDTLIFHLLDSLCAKLIDVDFDLTFQHAATGLPSEVKFNIYTILYDLCDQHKLEKR